MSKTRPYSVEDIHNILSNSSLDMENSVLHIDSLKELDYNLEKIFGERYSIILFIPNEDPLIKIGHFVLLSWLEEKLLEYFDSFAQEPHDFVKELVKMNNLKLRTSSQKLQEDDSLVCSKFCLLRMQSLPTHLDNFIKILKNNDKLTPDQIVDFLINSLYKKQ